MRTQLVHNKKLRLPSTGNIFLDGARALFGHLPPDKLFVFTEVADRDSLISQELLKLMAECGAIHLRNGPIARHGEFTIKAAPSLSLPNNTFCVNGLFMTFTWVKHNTGLAYIKVTPVGIVPDAILDSIQSIVGDLVVDGEYHNAVVQMKAHSIDDILAAITDKCFDYLSD